MLPQEIIRKKRDGQSLLDDEIAQFVQGVAQKNVSEEQVAAFCMAVLLKKMNRQERVALTLAMARSGTIMDWSKENLSGPVLDKHSTGGVGDKVSLMLAPIIAACGGYVPMIAGRGLGHTGGTIDKLDAIKGYRTQPDMSVFKKAIKDCGCAIIGATLDIAPADRVMYAVRDATATVESIDLITASILSKKLAAGLQGLVLDIKCGSGAFMRTQAEAQELAENLVQVANGAGLPTMGLLTDMNQILGRTAGNALEVIEAVDYLKNENVDPRLHEITTALAVEMLVLGKLAKTTGEAREKIERALASGKAAEHFAKMVSALGGPADLMERPNKYLASAPFVKDFVLKGKIAAMDVFKIGIGIVEMGGGRKTPADTVDHAVGLSNAAGIGDEGRFTIHAKDETSWQRMAKTLEDSITLGGECTADDLVKQRVVM